MPGGDNSCIKAHSLVGFCPREEQGRNIIIVISLVRFELTVNYAAARGGARGIEGRKEKYDTHEQVCSSQEK
jgi:hypothetical protein